MLKEERRIQDVYEKRRKEKSQLYSWFNKGQLFWFQELQRALLGLLSEHGIVSLEEKTILDIGCGTGHWIREYLKLGATPANLAGIDLLDWRIDVAKRTCPANVRLELGNAEQLTFPPRSFDVISQFTVFSSILDSSMKQRVASEMLRVLKDDGCIIWYDFFVRNPANHDVRGISRKEIVGLFPECQIELRRVSLALPLVRLLAPYSWLLCYLLEKPKMFNTHYLGIIRKSST